MRSSTFAVAAFAGLAAAAPAPQELDLSLLNDASSVATGPTGAAVVQDASVASTVVVSSVATPSVTSSAAPSKRDLEKRTFGLVDPWYFYKGLECEIFHNCGGQGQAQKGWGCDKPTGTAASWSLITTSSVPQTSAPAASTSSSAPASSSVASTTSAAASACPTTPEEGTYCGFINPNDPCAPQPGGYGPQVTPDTASAFLAYPAFASQASAAPTVVPSTNNTQYTEVFKDLNAAISANSYLGLYTLTSYSAEECAAHCDSTDLCTSFNLYIERDPTQNPAANDTDAPTVWGTYCPDPASLTNFKCTLWGSNLDASVATNQGGYREQFQVVITGSNAYDKTNVTTPSVSAPPPAATTSAASKPPTVKPGNNCGTNAINAPKYHMGSTFIPGPFNAQVCANYAMEQNEFNRQAAVKKGSRSFTPCKMFNSYYLHKNDQPFGTYCSLYGSALDNSYATFGGSGSYKTHQSWTFEFDFPTSYFSW